MMFGALALLSAATVAAVGIDGSTTALELFAISFGVGLWLMLRPFAMMASALSLIISIALGAIGVASVLSPSLGTRSDGFVLLLPVAALSTVSLLAAVRRRSSWV